jgi:predicted ATPase with chaperone activity
MQTEQVAQLATTLQVSPAVPALPNHLRDTGLPEAMVEQLILKTLYFRSETLGRDLARSLGLRFSVIDEMIEFLKRQHLVQVRRSMGMGAISAVYALTEAGRLHAREYLEQNQYAGKAPVPLTQYAEMVKAQRWKDSWLTMERLEMAYRHMVTTPRMLSQLGPAVNAGKSFLVYGQPGNGKTYLAEALNEIDPDPIYMPYAIECQGQIIQLYDPIYHKPIVDEGDEIRAMAFEPDYDTRWFKTRRPFIVSGGELSLEVLDLSYNTISKFYDAPLQLKANNGIYLLDDFGRQKCTPAEILNRWIVPMERHVDYLTFQNGAKMNVPFEAFLIFSTNLNPDQLGDEAFLRRISYKMLMRNPSEEEFLEIFRRFADEQQLDYTEELLQDFLNRHYRGTTRDRRRCHPRDVINHAIDLIRFERRPWELNQEVLHLAFESVFVHDEDE